MIHICKTIQENVRYYPTQQLSLCLKLKYSYKKIQKRENNRNCHKLYCCLSSHFTVPQQGGLMITTEFGRMQVDPNEICVLQVSIVSSLSYSVCMLNHVFFLFSFRLTLYIESHFLVFPAQFVCMLNHVS